jgi:threonyl-tRNA synthetase
MRVLLIHADNFWFKVKEKAIESAEDVREKELAKDNVLVAFVSVEEGDEIETAKRAAADMSEVRSNVGASSLIIYPYAHLSSTLAPPTVAKEILNELEKRLRDSGQEIHRAPFGWYKEFSIHCLGHPLSELSRTIRNEEELSYSSSLDVCKKFQGATMMFFKQATLEYLKYLSGAKLIVDGLPKSPLEIGVTIKGNSGRILPCVNEKFSTSVWLKREIPIPSSFEDGVNHYALLRKMENGLSVDLERYIYYLLLQGLKREQNGLPPAVPLWMSPIQVRILPVAQKYLSNAIQIAENLSALRVDIDDTEDRLGNKIRRAGGEWIPFIALVGEREVTTNTLSVRVRETGEQTTMTIDELKRKVEDPLALRQTFPRFVSERP